MMPFMTDAAEKQGKPDWFGIQSAREKIQRLPEAVSHALQATESRKEFTLGRDLRIVSPADLPGKPGLSSPEGQARLLHDLASIELQAMELAVRTLGEYPDAPHEFRRELAEVAFSEGRHLTLCLDAIERLGYRWGAWDAHVALWNTVSPDDTLIDRVLIVHRYLEGSGLDAGESILRRLSGVADKSVRDCVRTIVSEEVDHVLFGSLWYRRLAELEHLDPEKEFAARIVRIATAVPRRERLARDLRKKAGFTEFELDQLQRHQTQLYSQQG